MAATASDDSEVRLRERSSTASASSSSPFLQREGKEMASTASFSSNLPRDPSTVRGLLRELEARREDGEVRRVRVVEWPLSGEQKESLP